MTQDQKSKLVFLALGLVIGGFTGAGAAWVISAGPRTTAVAGEGSHLPDVVRPEPLPRSDPLATTERAPAERTGAVAAPLVQADVFDEIQRTYGRAGIERGWARERADPVPAEDMGVGLAQYEEIVRTSPDSIGLELARRRTKAEQTLRDSQTGGVLTLLDKLAAGGGPILDVVRDPERFDAFFPRQTGESFVDGPAAKDHPDRQIENGVTLSFPAGVFRLRGLMQERHPFPSDVTIAGAGMDATLLVLDQALYTRGQLVRFGIRDCTMNTRGHYLLDLRTEPASIQLERARFVGFGGSGSCCLIGAVSHGAAVRAIGCRFEGGYERSSWCCNIFDVRNDALIARFDRCGFDQVSLDIFRWQPGTTALFSACTLTEMLDERLVTDQAATKPGVAFDGCSFTYFAGDRNQIPSKDLNTLFPDWKQRLR